MKSKDLLALIPVHVRVSKDVTYEVVWCDEFPNDPKQVGECRHEARQIVIKKNESPTETFSTYIHECLHMLSFETPNLNLTEKQVGLLERAIVKSLKLNGVLNKLV